MPGKISISRGEIEKMQEAGNAIVLIDVRTDAEFQEKHIPGAINIPLETIENEDFITAEGESVIVFACGKGGGRSERAAAYLRGNGGINVFFLEGGTVGWDEVSR